MTLTTILQEEIKSHGGAITFDRFMSLALYHSEWGYYCSDLFNIGKEGDFTTAPEISPLFSQCFARQYQQFSAALPSTDILELGAGTGQFAGDFLNELEHLGCLPENYLIYEISPSLRQKQLALIQSHFAQHTSRIKWLDALPSPFKGMIIANEVLDALPVHCFKIENNSVKERCVTWKDNQFDWTLSTPSAQLAEVAEPLKMEYSLPNGYESETCLQLTTFIQSLAACLDQGIILFADYGYGQREYYHPQRNHGTLTCFYQHHHHDNPLMIPGQQDITAHVDFTRLVEIASAEKMSLLGYTTQAAFLLACGLLDIAAALESQLNPVDQFKLHQAIKTLTLPTEMGERIKIMGLGKNIELPLLMGFSMQDRRREL